MIIIIQLVFIRTTYRAAEYDYDRQEEASLTLQSMFLVDIALSVCMNT